MKILAIRGSNLASLSGNFEIDLTAEPLKSSGLFAITGETGAGKSTLLDAICLALYANCPRLSGAGVNDNVPDIAGEEIKSTDARSIVRRGAPGAHAEIDFLASDGVRYRASWAVRRARGKAVGRLQNVDRALVNLDTGKVLESQVNRVKDKVVEITGLTYDEFRRTCLLAQGDFDAFLRANTSERAALLEKITGTEVYRSISKRIYQRNEDAKAVLNNLEQRAGAVLPMTQDEREELMAESTALTKSIAAVLGEISAVSEKIQSHKTMARAVEQLKLATEELDKAESAFTSAKADEDQLSNLKKALSLKSENAHLATLVANVIRIEQSHAQILSLRSVAGTATDTAKQNQEKTQRQLEQVEKTFKETGPIWTKATRLDEKIEAAQLEKTAAEEMVAKSLSKFTSEKDGLENIDLLITEKSALLATAVTTLEKAPETHILADQWGTIAPLMDQRQAARVEIGKSEAAVVSITARITTTEAEILAIKSEVEADQEKLQDIEATLKDATAQLDKLMQGDHAQEAGTLGVEMAKLVDLQRICGTYGTTKGLLTSSEADIATAEKGTSDAKEELRLANLKFEGCERDVMLLQTPLDRAEAAVSKSAETLRQSLERDCACPVCGSTEHPIMANQELADLAEMLRKDLAARRGLLEAARREVDVASRKMDASAAAAGAAGRSVVAHSATLDGLLKSYADIHAKLVVAVTGAVPDTPVDAAGSLAAAIAKAEARKAALATLAADEREARKQVDLHTAAQIAINKVIATKREKLHAHDTRLASVLNEKSMLAQQIAQKVARVAEIDVQIAPALAAVKTLPSRLDSDPATKEKLGKLVQWWKTNSELRKSLSQELEDLKAKKSLAGVALKSFENALSADRAMLETRTAALGEATAARVLLLGGEATDAHRSRHNDARTAAQEASTAAGAALAAAQSHLADLNGRFEATIEAMQEAIAVRDAAKLQMDEKLAANGLTKEQLDALLPTAEADARRITDRIDALKSAVTSARAAMSTRQSDLEELNQKDLPEEDLKDLETVFADHEIKRDDLRERAGAISNRISNDNDLRDRIKDILEEVNEAKAVCETWAAINEAVGSRQGDKFSQIAQSVTLSMLVERANLQLEGFAPRYQMTQGGDDLALHIVDQDMGDEIRSTRSLSGGERFLVSLSLALALSGMGSHGGLAETLFIDEGFGSLDAESLDMAMGALETLQAQGRKIGVISHVEAMKDRIPVQIHVAKRGAGASFVEDARIC